MSDGLISVIVPVYAAERYLDQCVASVIAQSYSHFELLLVDDGSPDASGELCDEWASRDKRVRVLHRENGGPSASRNTGLDAAQGEFFCFVDADDWVDPAMLSTLLAAAVGNSADIAACAYCVATLKGEFAPGPALPDFAGTTEDALRQLCLPNSLGVMVWNKLFRSSELGHLRFRETPQSQSEDFDFVVEAIKLSRRVARTHVVGYFYRQRVGSLMHSGTISMAGVDVARNLRDYVSVAYPESLPFADYLYSTYLVDAYVEICRAGKARSFQPFLSDARAHIEAAWVSARLPPLSESVRESAHRMRIWRAITGHHRLFEMLYPWGVYFRRLLRRGRLYQ